MYQVNRVNQQKGSTLTIALVLLVVISLIGFSAMETSISALQVSDNLHQQTLVTQQVEEVLKSSEAKIMTIRDAELYALADLTDIPWGDVTTNPAIHSAPNGLGEYIILYRGETAIPGEAATVGVGEPIPGSKAHIYQSYAHSEMARKAKRVYRSHFIHLNGPAATP